MSTSRLDQLFEFQKEEPNDPFILFAIALEFQKIDSTKAMEYFTNLLLHHENYTGTYYHAAKLLETLGKKEEAIKVYEKGIIICRNENKLKAVNELMSALNNLKDEEYH